MPMNDTPDRAANGSGGKEELAADIEQTRQDLGETIDALAAKADLPARARRRTAELREQAGERVGTLTRTVREQAPRVRDQAGERLTTLTHSVRDTAQRQAPRVRAQVSAPIAKAGQAIPEPARRTATRATRQAADVAGRQPLALYGAAAVCGAAGVWLWWRSR